MVKMLNDMLLAQLFPDFSNFQMHSRLSLAHGENHVRVTAAKTTRSSQIMQKLRADAPLCRDTLMVLMSVEEKQILESRLVVERHTHTLFRDCAI